MATYVAKDGNTHQFLPDVSFKPKPTHTPGPWHVIPDDMIPTVMANPDNDGEGYILAEVMSPLPTCQADARLIAAAPDLLAACKDALDCMEHSQPPEGGRTDAVCQRVRAAIAKAEAAP